MMSWQESIDNFLKINNAECRNRFNEEIYNSIKDEDDREFYKWSSCIPCLIMQPSDFVPKMYIICTSYKPSSGHFCRNPHHRINKILQKRLDKIGLIEMTQEGVEFFLNSEVTCD